MQAPVIDVRGLARNISVDVSEDGATWLRLPGRLDAAPQITPNKVDATDYDSDGWKNYEVTLQEGVVTVKYAVLREGGVANPAQELVRLRVGQFGAAARLYVRWYDNDGGAEGWRALAIVEQSRAATAVADLMQIQATFTLDGPPTRMTPADIAAALGAADDPVVLSAGQTGAGPGSLVTIGGAQLAGATGVAFGTEPADHTVVSPTAIVATVPADVSGATDVTVTTPAGTSAPFPITIA